MCFDFRQVLDKDPDGSKVLEIYAESIISESKAEKEQWDHEDFRINFDKSF